MCESLMRCPPSFQEAFKCLDRSVGYPVSEDAQEEMREFLGANAYRALFPSGCSQSWDF